MKRIRRLNRVHQFEAIFVAQEEGGFTVEVPDLPGCISEGDTLEEAEKNIQEAIELYLETLEERRIPIPERQSCKTLRMNIVITRGDRKKKAYA